MQEITIGLSERQVHFLKMFAANHYPGAKDNLATNKPIHVVQTRRERVVDSSYDSPDATKYYLRSDCTAYDSAKELISGYYERGYDEECPIEIVSFKEAYAQDEFTDINGEGQVLMNEEEYFEAYGLTKDMYSKVNIEYYYEPVAYFFILEEARRYIEYQRHNLCNPRTYTYSCGFANHGEYEHFWDLLFSIGKMLNEG